MSKEQTYLDGTPANKCADCKYWSGSIHIARCAPCLHPKDIELRLKGLITISRSMNDRCNGWTKKET